jgi:lipoprotein-anchoring transpeptidase ErfK/SrfK
LSACLAAAAAPTAAQAQAPAPGERITPGVSSGGIDLSFLTVDQAAQRLDAGLKRRMERAVVVRRAGKTFRLTPKSGRLALDSALTAKRALYAGRGRVAGAPPVAVPLAFAYSTAAVQRFAARVDRGLSIPARDARLLISLRRVKVARSRPGRDIDHKALAGQIAAALPNPAASRVFAPELRRTRAKLNADDLRKRGSTVITISRSTFKLRLFKRFKIARTYRVAVGQPAYPTPQGLFAIQSKQVNPTWSVPNSPWAGELAGTSVQGGGAANPLKARWMGVSGSVGIHGTGEVGSLGSRASHGCIRMAVPDVIGLFRRVSVGTPVLIR